jgi:hypothetical protein
MQIRLFLDAEDIIESDDMVRIPYFHTLKYTGDSYYDWDELALTFCPAFIGKPKKELDAIYSKNRLYTEIWRKGNREVE